MANKLKKHPNESWVFFIEFGKIWAIITRTREKITEKGEIKMKKIILVSVLFGLMTMSANATYYETNTVNCGDAAMMATLDGATAQHRAVITKVTCEMPVVRPTVTRHYQANKRFVQRTQRVYKHRKVCRRPATIAVINVVDSEYCDCGC